MSFFSKHFISKRFTLFISVAVPLALVLIAFSTTKNADDDLFLTCVADAKKQDVRFFWKKENGELIKNFKNLKSCIGTKHLKLLFAMNGGMYNSAYAPQGLYIENGTTLNQIDTAEGKGNFYMKPNGVFYITNERVPVVCKTPALSDKAKMNYATQSGPMLLCDGKMHEAFKKGSANLNIRNGVGILPDNKIVFVLSKREINFYDFASYFQKLGCKNALYLDGFVSRAYYPEKNWIQNEGDFGVIIALLVKQTSQ